MFGICTEAKPYLLVTQFHGIDGKCVTFNQAIRSNVINNIQDHITVLLKCADALSFIHSKQILHNDIKGDNVVVSKIYDKFFPVLIDFGKAVNVVNAKVYTLSPKEQDKYRKYHKHIAPELVRGTHKQSTASDIYSFGLLISLVCKHFPCEPLRKLAFQCIHCNPNKRPLLIHLQNEFHNITFT